MEIRRICSKIKTNTGMKIKLSLEQSIPMWPGLQRSCSVDLVTGHFFRHFAKYSAIGSRKRKHIRSVLRFHSSTLFCQQHLESPWCHRIRYVQRACKELFLREGSLASGSPQWPSLHPLLQSTGTIERRNLGRWRCDQTGSSLNATKCSCFHWDENWNQYKVVMFWFFLCVL